MNGWICNRKETPEDRIALEAAARRFAARHADVFKGHYSYANMQKRVDAGESSWWGEVEEALDEYATMARSWYGMDDHVKYMRRLWLRCLRRALNDSSAEGISWGYVGYSEPKS